MSKVLSIEKTRFYLRVLLEDGEELRLHKQAMSDLPLKAGDDIQPAEYMARLAIRQENRALETALDALESGDRTERKMREYLLRRYFPAPCVDAVLSRLKAQGLIDDEKYARRYAETHPGEGKYALRRKLQARGVGAETSKAAAEMLTDEDQLAAAKKEAEKLERRYAACEPREKKRKMSQALARRGFGWDIIAQALGGEYEDWEE